jgi:hypothetical protein
MSVYVSNIVIDIGSDFTQTFYLETASNTPLNLTGYTATSKMKKHPSSSSTAATFVVSFSSPNYGALRLSLGSTITSGLKPGRYCYDVLVNDGLIKTRVVEGSALVTAGITTG